MSIRAILWARDVSARINVPPAERILLIVIATYHHDKTGDCFPSYDTLAENTGWKKRAVIQMAGRLESNGLIVRQKRRVNGHQASNHFVLFGHPKGREWNATRVHGDAPSQSARGGTQTRVHGDAPDRDSISTRGKSYASGLAVFDGGRKHA